MKEGEGRRKTGRGRRRRGRRERKGGQKQRQEKIETGERGGEKRETVKGRDKKGGREREREKEREKDGEEEREWEMFHWARSRGYFSQTQTNRQQRETERHLDKGASGHRPTAPPLPDCGQARASP
jgi:hypothetical protein